MSATATDSDRRLAAACVLGSYAGAEVPTWLLERVRDGLGGVLLFAQNVVDDAHVASACARLREARDGVVIAIDEEGGDVTRLDAATGSDVPSPGAFGAVDDVGLTHDAFAGLGARVRSLGIDLVLAPCADVNSNPRNPVIGLRSFGATADVAARHVAAAVRGFRASGLAVCAKHYPGHGDTCADTHLGPARVAADLATLTSRDLVPFDAAFAAGADAVLTAHVVAGALDDAPVSLSRRWTDHLRAASGFTGALITDALDMDAVAAGRGIAGVAEASVAALAAGADLLCLGSDFDAAATDAVLDAIVGAIGTGRLDRAALVGGAARAAALRRIDVTGPSDLARPDAARTVADRAIRVDSALPTGPYAVVECRPRLSMACFNVRWGIADDLRRLGWPTLTIEHDDGDPAARCAELLERAGTRPVVVVVRDADVHLWQRGVVEQVAARRPGAAVMVEMGWPGEPVPGVVRVVTHGAARVSARALIARLGGAVEGRP